MVTFDFDLASLAQRSAEYRKEQGLQGGYVIFEPQCKEITGWSKELRAEAYVPGACAVGLTDVLVAEGGNSYDGAKTWRTIND